MTAWMFSFPRETRMFVAFGPDAEKQKAWQQTLPMFNTVGKTLEWRLRKEAGA